MHCSKSILCNPLLFVDISVCSKMEPNPYHNRLYKFSCKPRRHDDGARQRENQRRHRAKVKGRIAELEASLLSAQSRLDDALKRIESLTAEVQRLQHAPGSRSTTSIQATAQQQPVLELATRAERYGGPLDRAESHGMIERAPSALDLPPGTAGLSTLSTPVYSPARDPRSTSPQSLVRLPENSQFESGVEGLNNDCALLPPPGVGESTMPCREAYLIIKNHSSPDFDVSTATEWLQSGFRGAVAPGTGCRVQTHILFAFVDHITSI